MALAPEFALPLMDLAACLWTLAFASFLYAYAPMLARRTSPIG
jgi:uncharacterized protein involved in response to NO